MSKVCEFSTELACDRVLEQALAQQAGGLQTDGLELELEENTGTTVNKASNGKHRVFVRGPGSHGKLLGGGAQLALSVGEATSTGS